MPSVATTAPDQKDRLLTMKEVAERLRYAGQEGVYRLIREDPEFVTFKVGDAANAPRLMRESALDRWVRQREARERPELTSARK